MRAETAVGAMSAGRWRRVGFDFGAVIGIAVLAVIIGAALTADLVAPYDPTAQNVLERRSPPSELHFLGTDGLGRDIMSRLIFGARLTLVGSLLAVSLSVVVGVPLGLIAGFRRGITEAGIMRGTDVLLAFPSFLLAIVIVAILGPSLQNAAIAVGIAGIPAFARLVRGSVLGVRERDYVLAAISSGAGEGRLIMRYILPNVLGPILVLTTLSLGTAVLSIAGLSFLGLGAQPPSPEWGVMLRDGRDYLRDAPHITFIPGIAIMLLVLAFNLIGDALHDRFNPRLQSGRSD